MSGNAIQLAHAGRIWLGSVFCDPSAVEMRNGARLSSVEFTLLSPSGPASRTSDGEYLFWAEFLCHTNLQVQKVGD
jgi:hypothetical protein